MSEVRYEEVHTTSALNPVKGMGFKWSLNPYQGCTHGCHYCFARRYQHLRELDPGDDFSSRISVKTNIPEVLRRELARPSWKNVVVAVGTATDPHQPIEGKYRLTRRCLEEFSRKANPINLITKGTLVVRDVDLLADLARRAGCTVCISVTTMDRALASRLEPGTPPPHKRLRAMERLAQAGVNAGVLMAPIIPGITDGIESMTGVAQAAAQHGARFLRANTLYLKEGTKEHFLGFLSRDYPDLVGTYRTFYPGAFAPWGVKRSLEARIASIKYDYGLGDKDRRVEEPPRPRQLQLVLR